MKVCNCCLIFVIWSEIAERPFCVMDTFASPCIEAFRFAMSEQTAELLTLALLLLLVLVLLLLQPVTSTPVTTHAAATRLPKALRCTVTPLLIAGQARQASTTAGLPVEASSLASADASPTLGEGHARTACRHAAGPARFRRHGWQCPG
jgi:hypothetical protein